MEQCAGRQDTSKGKPMSVKREVYSPEEVAVILGMSLATIRRWLRKGKLRGTKIGGVWIISKTEIERILGDTIKDTEGE